MSLSITEYSEKFKDRSNNYQGIKESPLIKYKDYLIIINWNFISNKLYDSLIFDFYKVSKISHSKKYSNFPNFKNYIANEITDKKLFRKLIPEFLNVKYSVLKFDDQKVQGFPDCYWRHGKYIFLFEIKDAFFPAKITESYSYGQIKEVLDKKYNTDSKGTGQIIKHLLKLKSRLFEDKNLEELKLKQRNLVIYPIIVYTDFIFQTPGFNRYLSQELKIKIKKENLQNEFSIIKDLSFINISFFVNSINLSGKFSMKNLLDSYLNHLRSIEKKISRNKSIDLMNKLNIDFELYSSRYFKKNRIIEKDPKFRKTGKILGLHDSFPE